MLWILRINVVYYSGFYRVLVAKVFDDRSQRTKRGFGARWKRKGKGERAAKQFRVVLSWIWLVLWGLTLVIVLSFVTKWSSLKVILLDPILCLREGYWCPWKGFLVIGLWSLFLSAPIGTLKLLKMLLLLFLRSIVSSTLDQGSHEGPYGCSGVLSSLWEDYYWLLVWTMHPGWSWPHLFGH